MQKSKSKLKVTTKSNDNDVKSAKLPRSIQKSDNILGNTCKSYSFRIFIFMAQIRRWVFVGPKY